MMLERRAVLCLALLATVSFLSATADAAEERRPRQHVADEILVKLRSDLSPAAATAVLGRLPSRETRGFRAVDHLYRLKLTPGVAVDHALGILRRHPDVVYAEPNFTIQRSQSVIPNDPYYPYQWSLPLNGIDAEAAWRYTTGSSQVVVAVLDTGIDLLHEDLVANIYRNEIECTGDYGDHDGNGYLNDCSGVNVLTGGAPVDDHGHGTHVAGVIGAVGNNWYGIAGVNWNVKILPCKFLDSLGNGTVAGAIACLDYVAGMKARGVNVVATNNSWTTGEFSQALHDAIKAHRDRGIVFVTPAGNVPNDNDLAVPYPCALELTNILCVGASDQTGTRAAFSAWGRTTVHLNAPGVGIMSTWPSNAYYPLQGTSIAGAHVSGVVALLAAQDPTRDWRALKNLVLAGAMGYLPTGETLTDGRLSASASLGCELRYAYGRLTPRRTELTLPAGTPLTLSFLLTVCATPYATPLAAIVQATGEQIPLEDSGSGPDQVGGDGVFTGTWTPPAAGGTFDITFPDSDTIRVTVEGSSTASALRLKPGFPVKVNNSGGGYTLGQGIHVLVGNIDDEPLPEILVSGLGTGELHAFKGDGTPVPGWPVVGPFGAPYPTLGRLLPDVAGSTRLQVFSANAQGGLAARSGTGAMLPGWPRRASNYIASPATLVDVDGDGIDEIFTEEEDWKLHAYRADGSLVPGWPHAGFWGGQERHTSAAADLDGDGRIEIVTASGWTSDGVALLAHRSDGTLMPGFPVFFSGFASTYPVIGDIDGDGVLEILVVGRLASGDAGIHVYSATGALVRVIQGAGTVSYGTALALADLDGDGVPEIVMQTDSFVNVFKGDGSIVPGWPATLPPFARVDNSSPVVGDVDGDGQPDIVILAPIAGGVDGTGQLLVFNRHGVLFSGFPHPIAGIGFGAVPAIADVDGDGRNDIIVAADYWSGMSGVFDKVWAFDFPDSPAPHGPILWGQFMGGPKHHGVYGPEPVAATHTLTVGVSGAGQGQVSSSPAGITCPSDCSRRYLVGTTVTLTATPDAVSTFTGWTGACAGQGNPCTLTVGADLTATATFAGGVTLTVVKSGSGSGTVTSSPAGITCGGDCSETYRSGTAVTLTPAAMSGSTFTGWSGVCAGQPGACSFTLGAETTVTATFAPPVELTVQAPGDSGSVTSLPAGINCGTDCSEAYTLGTMVTLSFTPAPKHVLVEWTGACAGSPDHCAVTMTNPVTVGVSVARLHTLTVTRAGSGGGSVASSPAGLTCGSDCSEDYRDGTTVTLTATPASGSVFTGWSGACAGQASTCSVAMTSDQSVTATFAPLYTLTVAQTGTAGTVTSAPAGISCGTDCTEVYVAGTSVTLTATPGSGSAFASWTGACAGQGNPCTLSLTADTAVTANFGTARTLTVAVNGAGTVASADGRIACPGDCSEIYANGTVVTLTATPAPGASFRNWSGACSGSATTCTVTMSAARSVTARFK